MAGIIIFGFVKKKNLKFNILVGAVLKYFFKFYFS